VVGRLQPGKRQDRFLRALANLRAKGLPIEGLLVGGDAYGLSTAYAAAVGRLIDELRLRPHVTVTGQVADAIPYIRGLDILVNASEDEAFGIVLVEAMACGVPVVAVGKGGPTEIVEPTTGVLVATGEPAELAAGIERLVVDAQLRAALGAGSRAAFERRFSIAAMGQQFGAEIRKLVDG
jgi:glycosyltransferase involved in cell wall biosynthesis